MTKKKLSAISAVSFCFLMLFLLAALNRTGSLSLFWKEDSLGSVTRDEGYGYYAFVRDPNIRSLNLPFFLKEDGRIVPLNPLSVNEDITASIKEEGGGAYQLLDNGDLYLSAMEGDPENHEYSIISPMIIRNRYLLVLFLPAAAGAAALLFICFRRKKSDPFKNMISWGTLILFLLLLIPWDRLTFPAAPFIIGGLMLKPVMQRNAVFLCILAAFLILHYFVGKCSKMIRILAVLIICVNTVYYFIPEWNRFGRRADSGDYLRHYDASSIRTPGYPKFIEAVYGLTGNDGLAEVRSEGETAVDERLWDGTQKDSRGLLSVARAQKILLGAAFLIFFAVFRRFYPPEWFVFIAQIILCCGFLGVDNSYIMSECLSQTVILLIAAALLAIFKEKLPALFPVLCVLAGIGILIRPANIFLVIPIFAAALVLIRKRENLAALVGGCLAFIAICAIPAMTIYSARGFFVWMPTSGYVEMARAADLMQPGDENAFDDPELVEFCTLVLDKKQQYPDADQNTYMWQVAEASAEEMGYDRISCSRIFGKVSRRIFMLHPREFAGSLFKTIKTGLERTRLHVGPVPFAALAALFIILFLLQVNTDSLTGLILMLMHCAHLLISMMNQPERRYIYSTEILCLLAWLLITLAFLKKAGHRGRS